MFDPARLLFIHGSDSNSQTHKARLLREIFPEMVVPDFTGPLEVRMAQLEAAIGEETGWTLIGSSFGGLMAVMYADRHPGQVRKLVLLAPALTLREFTRRLPDPIPVPAILIHGKKDDVVRPAPVHRLAKRIFPKLVYLSVDDDHRLHYTAGRLDWKALLA